MKHIQYLPIEFKPDPATREQAEGRYLIPHPLIDRYFFEVNVMVSDHSEKITVKLVCLVSKTKSIFRNVTRYCTWDDAQMVRDTFFSDEEEVIQYQRVNYQEVAEGNYFSNLFKIKPTV